MSLADKKTASALRFVIDGPEDALMSDKMLVSSSGLASENEVLNFGAADVALGLLGVPKENEGVYD